MMRRTHILQAALAALTVSLVFLPATESWAQDVGRRAVERTTRIRTQARQIDALTARLTASEDEVAALRDRLAAVEAAVEAAAANPKAGKDQPTATSPTATGSAVNAARASLLFREKVLAAIEPELATIETRLGNTVAKGDYAGHTHTFTKASHGWATMAVISACPGCLVPYLPPSKQGVATTVTTSTPK